MRAPARTFEGDHPEDRAFDIAVPQRRAPCPVVFDSPHSGFDWPEDFHPVAPRDAIRATWDAYVDELFAGAPQAGVSLLSARFPRAYIDVNRAENDLDPSQLADGWTGVLAPSDYCRRGMGLIRRDAVPGAPMYDGPLSVTDVERRLRTCYRPYRAALRAMLDEAHADAGVVWHFNLHSMRSRGSKLNLDAGQLRPDVVVSDRMGTSANNGLTARVIEWFDALGFRVQMNDPYRGGELVRMFGDPKAGRNSIQLGVNRALYMNERTFEKTAGFTALLHTLTSFAHELSGWVGDT